MADWINTLLSPTRMISKSPVENNVASHRFCFCIQSWNRLAYFFLFFFFQSSYHGTFHFHFYYCNLLFHSSDTFYPAALKGSEVTALKSSEVLSSPEQAGMWAVGHEGGRAAGQAIPVNTLTSAIFHVSFSNDARIFTALRSQSSLIMEVLPH